MLTVLHHTVNRTELSLDVLRQDILLLRFTDLLLQRQTAFYKSLTSAPYRIRDSNSYTFLYQILNLTCLPNYTNPVKNIVFTFTYIEESVKRSDLAIRNIKKLNSKKEKLDLLSLFSNLMFLI